MSMELIDHKFDPKSAETETEICELYSNILKNVYKISRSRYVNEIYKAIRNIRSCKNRDIEIHKIVTFENEADRIAYVFAYGIIHSVVIYDRFSDMLKKNPTLLKQIVTMKKIRLCILGGGPAVEVISICKLLNNILANLRPEELSPLQILITIIDECGGWGSDAKAIVKCVEQYLCDAQKVKLEFCFIEADITKVLSHDARTAIKKSHFVTMVKVISEINDASYEKLEITDVIYNIFETMRPKSCLFYLDTAGGGTFKKIDIFIDKVSESARIYGPCLFNTHVLNLNTVQLFTAELSRKPYSPLRNIKFVHECTNRISISCSAWMKVRDTLNLDEIWLSVSQNVRIDKPINVHNRLAERKHAKKTLRKFLQNAQKDHDQDDI